MGRAYALLSKITQIILHFADMAAILILLPGHPIMIIKINIFLCEQLISMFIIGCPGGKINMAAVSAKRSMVYQRNGVSVRRISYHDSSYEELKTTLTCSARAKVATTNKQITSRVKVRSRSLYPRMFTKLSSNLVVKLKAFVQAISTTCNSLAFGLFSDECQTIQAEIWLHYDYLPQQSQSL